MLAAHPVRVRQVDADGCGGVEVTGQDGCRDDLGRHALDLFLLELRCHGRVVFKPLRVFRQLGGALGGGQVLEVDDGLPRSLHAQRVAVAFGEVAGEVHEALRVAQPVDGIFVEGAQVARAVHLYQQVDDLLLGLGVGVGACLEQVVDDVFECRRIHAAHAPHPFGELSELVALQARVHAHHHGARVGRSLALGVEGLGLGLRDARCVVVAGRGQQEVFAVLLVHAHGHDGGVEHDGQQLVAELCGGLSRAERQLVGRQLHHGFAQEVGAEARLELLTAVVVVDAR